MNDIDGLTGNNYSKRFSVKIEGLNALIRLTRYEVNRKSQIVFLTVV